MQEKGRRLRVLYLHYHIHPTLLGGGERSLLCLLKALDKTVFEPIVGIPTDKGLLYEELSKLGVRSKIVPFIGLQRTKDPLQLLSFVLGYIRATTKLVRLTREEKVDLIHANSIMTQLYGGVAASFTGVPIIYHVRNIIRLDLFGRLILRVNSKLARRVIANSRATKEMLLEAGVEDAKCTVVYNAVDLQEYSTLATGSIRRELDIKEGTPIIGIVGAIEPLKGQEIFIRAASIVLRRWAEVKFLIIGDVRAKEESCLEYSKELESLAKELDVYKNVVFVGYKHNIGEIIADLDILVNASRMDAFGRTLIEAMALRKPVIATNVGGIPEVVLNGETGLVIEPEDPDALAEAIEELLRDRDRAKTMGERGRKRVEKLFSLERHVRAMENEYLAII